VRDVAVGPRREPRVVRVRDRVDVRGVDAAFLQAPARGGERHLPRRERHRLLAVLAAAEALLLRRGDRDAVDDERSSRVVEHGVDAEDAHVRAAPYPYETSM
jgi:hypothetical protein